MQDLIPESWQAPLQDELRKDYFKTLTKFLEKEYESDRIFPPKKQIFEALNLTPYSSVKVVIIGQDPYHGQGQAHGLAFSVRKGVKIPPSLKNIYKELASDIGFIAPDHGYLKSWATQGVLLLNSVLTVRESRAGSHSKKGWESFTDRIVQVLNQDKRGLVFLLWGNYAKEKGACIDRQRHFVLECAHPSPFSAKKFFGNRHFSQANRFLISKNHPPIDWSVVNAPHQEQKLLL